MSGRSRFSRADKDAIVSDYLAGMKVELIALLHDCAPTYPSRLAIQQSITVRRSFKRRARLTIRDRNQIVAAWVAGESGASVAARFGCDPTYPGLLARRRGHTRVEAEVA